MAVNKKIIKTENKIKQAFIYLVRRDGVNHLTVNDILKYAQINRTTFYKHYQNKFSLIHHYEQRIIQDIQKMLFDNMKDISDPEHKGERKSKISFAVNQILDYISRDFEMFQVMIGPHGDPNLERKLKNVLRNFIDRDLYRIKGNHRMNGDLPDDYAHEIVLSQIIDIIKFWLKKKYPESPDEVAKIIVRTRYLSQYQILGINNEE